MKLSLNYWFIIIGFLLTSCSVDYPEGYHERLQEFEENWEDCYRQRFKFSSDKQILEPEYLMCTLDTTHILINNKRSGLEGTVTYEYGFSTFSPDLQFEGQSVITNKLHIGFVAFGYQHIGFKLGYPTDSLNFTIQNTFNNNILKCASNFIEGLPEFKIGTGCPVWSVYFSTLFSLKEDQVISIDTFSYHLSDGKWLYHLVFSFGEIEVTNEVWNSSNMVDIRGRARKSDVFIENLLIKDLTCVVNFELPVD